MSCLMLCTHPPSPDLLSLDALAPQLEPQRRLGVRVGIRGQYPPGVADGGEHLRGGGR